MNKHARESMKDAEIQQRQIERLLGYEPDSDISIVPRQNGSHDITLSPRSAERVIALLQELAQVKDVPLIPAPRRWTRP